MVRPFRESPTSQKSTPLVLQDAAVQKVLQQAEALSVDWAV